MIVEILGPNKYGKTLTLTFLGLYHWLSGYRIITNYYVAYPHEKLKFIEQLENDSGTLQKPIWFSGDELASDLDSRDSQSEKNKFITRLLRESRKRLFSFGYTSQIDTLMDRRVRLIVEYQLMPEMYLNEENEPRVNVQVFSKSGYITQFDIDPQPIWNLYDTREIVNNEELDKELIEYNNEKYFKRAKEVLELKIDLKKKYPKIKIESILKANNLRNHALNYLLMDNLNLIESKGKERAKKRSK